MAKRSTASNLHGQGSFPRVIPAKPVPEGVIGELGSSRSSIALELDFREPCPRAVLSGGMTGFS